MFDKDQIAANEARFHRAVFCVLSTHSLLDMNLGYCLSNLKSPMDPRSTYDWISGLSCSNKIQELRKLLTGKSASSYEQWANQSTRIRAIRNGFAHGFWEYTIRNTEKPIGLTLPAWTSKTEHLEERMSIVDLEEIATEVDEYFKSFCVWRKEYGS